MATTTAAAADGGPTGHAAKAGPGAEAAAGRRPAKATTGLIGSIRDLRMAPRELWIIFFLKVLESYAYFSMSLSMTLYLTDELGFDDTSSGAVYGGYGFAISLAGVISGVGIDYLGVRWSLALGGAISAAGRFLFAVAQTKWMAYLAAFVVMPLGSALCVPVMVIGIKRSTSAQNRTFIYSLFYACMNIAGLLAGPATDLFRSLFADGGNLFGMFITPLRALFLTGVATSVIQALVAACGMRDVNVTADGELKAFKPKRGNVMKFLCQLKSDMRFKRLMVLALLVMVVRLVFRHLDATLPKYMLRTLGPDAAYGTVYAINPGMILVLVPIIGAYTGRRHPFNMILWGSFVAAASVFWLVLPPGYVGCVLFVVTLSLGEAVYSPRFYEYTMQIARNGHEGLYAGLANLPMVCAKFFVGMMSGVLLANFCPEAPPRECEIMWLIIGLITFIAPVIMLLARNFIEPNRNMEMHELEDDEDSGSDVDAPRQRHARVALDVRPLVDAVDHDDVDVDVNVSTGIQMRDMRSRGKA